MKNLEKEQKMLAEGTNFLSISIKTKGAKLKGTINIKYSKDLFSFLKEKDQEKCIKVFNNNITEGVENFEFINVQKIKYIVVTHEETPVVIPEEAEKIYHEVIIRFDDGEEISGNIELDVHYKRLSDQLKDYKGKYLEIHKKNCIFLVSYMHDGTFESIRHIGKMKKKPRLSGAFVLGNF